MSICPAIFEDDGDPEAPYACSLEAGHDDWHSCDRGDWSASWEDDEQHSVVIELGEELSDWACDWPKVNGSVVGSEKCNCGHESLEPGWHMNKCPAVVAMWKARAKILHEQVWELLAEVKALDPQWREAS